MFSDNLIGRTSQCSNVIRTQNLKKEKSYFISKSNEASILHPQILRAIIAFKDLTLYSCRVKLNQSSLWANCRDEPPLLWQTSAFKALSTWGLRNWCWFETGIENKLLYIQDRAYCNCTVYWMAITLLWSFKEGSKKSGDEWISHLPFLRVCLRARCHGRYRDPPHSLVHARSVSRLEKVWAPERDNSGSTGFFPLLWSLLSLFLRWES